MGGRRPEPAPGLLRHVLYDVRRLARERGGHEPTDSNCWVVARLGAADSRMQSDAHGSADSAHARSTEPDGRAFAHRDSALGHATSHDSATDP